MDKETEKIKKWLDDRFTVGVAEGDYFSHQPIYGYDAGRTEGRHLIRYAITLSILNRLASCKFDSVVDVGGAEGYTANLIKKIFNVPVVTCDLSFEANLRARELFGIDSIAIDITSLPFKDNAFDVVVCSEVIEHLVNPIQALFELKRIARKAVIITTSSICYDTVERLLQMRLIDISEKHPDRNWYMADDFITIFGKDTEYENIIGDTALVSSKGCPIEEVKAILKKVSSIHSFTRKGLGILVTVTKEPNKRTPCVGIDKIIEAITRSHVKEGHRDNAKDAPLSPYLIERLQCVSCGGTIDEKNDLLTCRKCGTDYTVKNGIPIMYTHGTGYEELIATRRVALSGQVGNKWPEVEKVERLFRGEIGLWSKVPRFMARRLLKLNIFRYNCIDAIKEKGFFGGLFGYFFCAMKQKVRREYLRVIKKANLFKGA